MEYLTELSNLIMSNVQYVLLGMTVMILLALIIFISINIKLARMNKKYNTMMKGMDEVNVEQLLLNHIAQVKENVIKVDELSKEYQRMKEDSKKHVQKVGVVRFNAFEDMVSAMLLVVMLTLVMQYSRKAVAGTDFTFQVALMATVSGGLYSVSGVFADVLGYSMYLYLITALAACSLIPILMWGKVIKHEQNDL